MGDIGCAVLLKEEVAFAGILHVLHAGPQLFQARLKLVLHARHRHHRAIVQALGALPWQILADAQAIFFFCIKGRVDDARGILAQCAANQKATVIDLRPGKHLNLRHRGAGILAAMRTGGLSVHFLKAVHAQIFICHIFHPSIYGVDSLYINTARQPSASAIGGCQHIVLYVHWTHNCPFGFTQCVWYMSRKPALRPKITFL